MNDDPSEPAGRMQHDPAGSPRRAADAPTGYAALVRANANYRRLWAGQVVSLLGDWFNFVATAMLVRSLTGSDGAVGALFAVRMIAPFLVSPFAGVVADRFDRRNVLIATDLLRAAIVVCFVLVDEPDDVWLLYVLTFAQLAVSGFFFPAHRAVLPELVTRRELGTANALGSATWSTMLALGAALGGVVAGAFGLTACFLIDSATFLVSAALLARIRMPERTRDVVVAGVRGALRAYVDGLDYLRRHCDLALVAAHKAANSLLVAGSFQVIATALSQERFRIGASGSTGFGIIMSVVGIGTGLGPIAVRRVTGDDDRRLRIALATSYGVTATGLVTVAVATTFPGVLLGALLRGVGSGMGWVFSTQILLHLVPDRMRGRVFSTEFALLTLCGSIGALVGGRALDVAGIDTVLVTMAVLLIAPGVLWGVWTARHPRG